ncbi:hypothetical protein HPB51_022614 [Rhipicephalus microplus]|uniref:Uncharacterized protein n=1 Tax=Rhipicephalus microplus TaxID=6941 RepID=A0A9J6EUZ2_RHIMP|nr:hypothetical protein HPB51_022614 [Rhipicephalus microplus]
MPRGDARSKKRKRRPTRARCDMPSATDEENTFTDDPEYNFSPRSSCIALESTVVVFAKFYNVDGNCQPRRSSVVLRAIRVRNEDEEGVERLWKRTHPDHIGEKRWKLRFEKDQPISGVPIFPNVKKRISYAAKIRVPWKSAATRVAECVGGFPLSQLLLTVVVMGIAVLIGYLVMCVVKSRPTPVKTYAWTTFRATASKSLLTRAVESATWLMDLRLSWIVVILAVVCLFGLWLGKSGLAPYSSKWAHSHGLICGAGARKMWQWSTTWAGKNLSSPVVSSRWPWVIVAASGLAAVLTAFHVLFLSKPRHVQDPDECFTIASKEYCF